MWCFDRWYASHDRAEEKRYWYVTEGASEAYIVANSENGSFGVLYEAPMPFSEWHAFGGDAPGRLTSSSPVDLGAILDRMQREGE